MENRKEVDITEDEAALYDRQIRLWGLDAQKRLRGAHILIAGLNGLGAEVSKNTILAGVKSITLLDHLLVTDEDMCCQFLVSRDDIGENRAKASLNRLSRLNPTVEVTADSENVADKSEEFFCKFDVVCISGCQQEVMIHIDNICREHKIKFFAGDVFGYFGYMFADLQQHEYSEEVINPSKKSDKKIEYQAQNEETKTVKKHMSFVSLKSALEFDWSTDDGKKQVKKTPNTYFIVQVLLRFRQAQGRDPQGKTADRDTSELLVLRDDVASDLNISRHILGEEFTRHCAAQLSPVCAIVGGVLAQEIVKAVSFKDAPYNNFFFFNGLEGNGLVDFIGG